LFSSTVSEQFAALQHSPVVLPVLLRQFFGIEIEVGLAQDRCERLAEQIAEGPARKRESTLAILAQHMNGQILHEGQVQGP